MPFHPSVFNFLFESFGSGFQICFEFFDMLIPNSFEIFFLFMFQLRFALHNVVFYVSSFIDSLLFLPDFDQRFFENFFLHLMSALVHIFSRDSRVGPRRTTLS
jgi:hypothetical protein